MKDGTRGLLSLSGECFIPCNLSCTITADNTTLTLDLVAVNESVAEVGLNEATMIVLEEAESIHVAMNTEKREVVEESEVSASNLSIWSTPPQTPGSEENEEGGGMTVSVVLIVNVLVLFLGLLIIIILFILLHFRVKTQLTHLFRKNETEEVEVELSECKEDETVQHGDEMESSVKLPVDASPYHSPPPHPPYSVTNTTLCESEKSMDENESLRGEEEEEDEQSQINQN